MATENKDEQKVLFDDQAFLWDFIKVFKNKSDYRNFIKLKDKQPSLTFNKLYGEGANALSNLTTAQLSSLVPKFRLYKSIEVDNKTINIEFPFNKFTTVDSIIDSALGRGSDVGFINVNWEDTGVNPASVGVAFSGNMVLKFQSFEALFKLRDSGPYTLAFADLLNPKELIGQNVNQVPNELKDEVSNLNINGLKRSIKMVVGWEIPTDPGGNLNIEIDKINEELKLIERTYIIENLDHSININNSDASIEVDIKFSARIEGMLLSTRADLLYIDPSNENEIDKKSRESIEKSKKSLLDKKKEVKEKLKKAQEEKEKQKNKKVQSGNTDLNKDIEILSDELEDLNKKLRYNISEDRAIAYRRLLTELRSNIDNPTKNSDGKIKYIDLPEDLYDAYLKVLLDSSLSRENLKEKKKSVKEEAEKASRTRLDDPTASEQDKKKAREEIQSQVKDASEKFQEDYRKKRKSTITQIEKQVKKAANGSPKDSNQKKNVGLTDGQINYPDPNDKEYKPSFYEPSPGVIRLHYFYLGDLIEAAMNIVYKRSLTKNNKSDKTDRVKDKRFRNELKLLLGPFVYYNPVTKESINISLADVPISMNYFNAWFFDNVIRTQLKNYPLRSFLRDICSKLLNNVMSPTRYGVVSPIKTFQTRIQSVRMQKDSEVYKYWTRNQDRPKATIDVDSVVSSTRQRGQNNNINSSINQTEWIHLYTAGSNTDALSKTPNTTRSGFNFTNNICHIYVGGQKGILKSISFARTQIPGKLESALSSGGDPARKNLLFQNKYDATIELFGNPVFKPGMLLWVDPRALGLGSIDTYGTNTSPQGIDFRYDLGIGGYYRIVNVSNELSSGLYVTKLTTVAELDLRDIRLLNRKQKAGDI
jgi:hypothetical protein